MIEGLQQVQTMVLAVAAGYLLGALPFAHIASRIRGIDVFATGSTLAGTANVFFNVGHRTGALVLVGDVVKGAAAVFAAWALGVPPALILVAGGAAVVGHWKSVFTRFKGGDGMAPLMGVAVALMPALAVLGFAAGLATIVLMRRSALRSTWGVSVCFLVMLAISQYYQIERDIVSGLVVLASLVLLRSMFTRRRRLSIASHPVYRDTEDDDDLEDGEVDVDPDSDLGRAASGPQ
ncbi:MAG: glycerol-3-phosphate acyltransferase [Chloroflexi bacterium]|nr:glycerol-3-phosphate acyltransferase [Chloroflexota bacterium]MCH8893715.1 glycerol-3-phosphate acyltransferase [Chloroflexota bacterium]MCH9016915.1 glycerol-3-phosphate acyltransferase [Chloroflexota bacterium]MCI0788003.1 glycerol-3-phosphate acyltransferase [Chloroflexota bacterium]MCI0801316.1 glycerol-3-phosphate acyltransferase [Chloroflexota bacterium]